MNQTGGWIFSASNLKKFNQTSNNTNAVMSKVVSIQTYQHKIDLFSAGFSFHEIVET